MRCMYNLGFQVHATSNITVFQRFGEFYTWKAFNNQRSSSPKTEAVHSTLQSRKHGEKNVSRATDW
jgi:hypothetical protein